jgi:hypothetical protein
MINNNLFSGSQFQQQQQQASGGKGKHAGAKAQQDQSAGSQAALQQYQATQFGNQFQQQAPSGLNQNQRVSGADSFSLKSSASVTPFSGASVQSQQFKPPSFGAVTGSEGPNKNFKATQSPQGGGDQLSQFRQQLNSGQLQFRGALPYTATQSWNA